MLGCLFFGVKRRFLQETPGRNTWRLLMLSHTAHCFLQLCTQSSCRALPTLAKHPRVLTGHPPSLRLLNKRHVEAKAKTNHIIKLWMSRLPLLQFSAIFHAAFSRNLFSVVSPSSLPGVLGPTFGWYKLCIVRHPQLPLDSDTLQLE